jgi:hypothetical protein
VDAARELGAILAERGIGLVYGGGHVGLMGILADAVLAGGGEVIGVIPRSMVESELAHRELSELIITASMHERKAIMADRADAFLALPGGVGTAEEFFEIVTWRQLRFHDKPIGLLNVAGFFDPLLAWIQYAFEEGFISEKHQGLIQVATTPAEAVAALVQAVLSTEC